MANNNKGMGVIIGLSVLLVGTAAYFIIKGLSNSKIKPLTDEEKAAAKKKADEAAAIDAAAAANTTTTTTTSGGGLFGGLFSSASNKVNDIFSKYGLTPYKPIDLPAPKIPLSDLGVVVPQGTATTAATSGTPQFAPIQTQYGGLFGFPK